MNEIKSVNQPGLAYEVVRRELPLKGKGYLIIRKCSRDQLALIIQNETQDLVRCGASKVYVSSTDPETQIAEGTFQAGPYLFRSDSTMDRLSLKLVGNPSHTPIPVLVMELLSPENIPLFLRIYNHCFFHVPNSATYGSDDIDRLLNSGLFQAEIVRYQNIPIGVIEVSYEELCPEIASLAILEAYRRKGLGREVLSQTLSNLAANGHDKVFLNVSSRNTEAYTMYTSMGFQQEGIVSTWHRFSR